MVFSVQCKACDATIYFSHDPLKGILEIVAHEDTLIKLTCPACKQVKDYDRIELVSREVKYAWL